GCTSSQRLTLILNTPNGVISSGSNGSINTTNSLLTLNIGSSYTLSATSISGTGQITKSGAGTLTLPALSSYTGQINVNAGKLILSGTLAPSNLAINGGTLEIAATVTPGGTVNVLSGATLLISGSGNLSGGSNSKGFTLNGIFEYASSVNQTLSGILSGAGSLVKTTSSSTLTVGNTGNTYTGSFSVTAGTLKANDNKAFGGTNTTGAITVSGTGALDLNGKTIPTSIPLSLSGSGPSGAGALINSSGTTAIYPGLLSLAGDSSIVGGAGLITLSNVGTINGNGYNLTLGGAKGGTIASIIGTGSGALTKQDAGTWTLSGANTYSGTTTISAGTLQIGNGGSTGTLGTGSVTNNASLIFNRAADTSISNVISGSGSVLATITGNLTLNSGASISSSGNDIVLSASGNFVNNAGSSVLSATGSGKRWIVYSADPASNTFGSLSSGNKALWGVTYATLAPASVSAGNRYVFSSSGGTVTASTLAGSKTYGAAAISLTDKISYATTGKAFSDLNSYGVYTSNTASDALLTTPVISSTGNTSTANAGSSYVYTFSTSGVANTGYSYAEQNTANFTVDKATVTISGISKTYDGSTSTGNTSMTITGVGSETLSFSAATYSDANVA
ncbi:MAG: hypothetical protein EBR59_09915, partial [Methylococcaceae bacterium]|nr:hypothetical protein [Methylococcaceae bacterium]